jgi:hypothetical protein
LTGNRKPSGNVISATEWLFEGIAMIKRYLPEWVRSETGDFYLTILFTTVATAELTYWCLSLPV